MSIKAVDDAFERLKKECERRGYDPYIMLRLAIRLGEMQGKTIPRYCEGTRQRKKPVDSQKRKIMCVETGKVYASTSAAVRDTGVTRTALVKALTGKHRTCAGRHWKYIK